MPPKALVGGGSSSSSNGGVKKNGGVVKPSQIVAVLAKLFQGDAAEWDKVRAAEPRGRPPRVVKPIDAALPLDESAFRATQPAHPVARDPSGHSMRSHQPPDRALCRASTNLPVQPSHARPPFRALPFSPRPPADASRASRPPSPYPCQDEALDLIYWLRQVFGVLAGFVWGYLQTPGLLGFAR
jgi:hypothetical protein